MSKVKKVLKDHFIPYNGNDHKPHFLRAKTVAKVLGAVLFLEIVFLAQIFVLAPHSDFFAAILKDVLISYANESRTADNLNALTLNPLLEEAAKMKAEDMASKGYFAHDSPEGFSPWYWFSKAGYKFVYAGENLAVNFVDSDAAHEAWMNSPTHRSNILHDKFTEIGIGTARGVYKGMDTIFVVELFGRPSVRSVAAEEPAQLIIAEEPIVKEETFIQVAVLEAEETTESPVVSVAGASASKTGFVSRVLATPDRLFNYIFGSSLALLALALLLKILIKINVQHPVLIANGMLVIAILSVILVVNYELVRLFGIIS